MKILSITAQKPHSTGSGTYLTELVKAFDEAGHKQAVVAGIYPDDQVIFPADVDFYPVYFIDFPIVGMSDSMPYASTKYSELTDEMIQKFETSFVKVIDEAISKLEPDVIICHHLFLLTAMVREHFPDKKIYGICHGSDLRQMINCPHLAKRVKPQIQKLDHIFALHDEQKIKIAEIFDIKNSNCELQNNFERSNLLNDKISIVGSGYNHKLFNCKGREAGDSVRVCFAGKVSNAKGAAELLDAVDLLNAKDKVNFELLIAGGCQEEAIRNRLKCLPKNVSYLGMLSQDELAKVYKSCDIFILPSYYEGLGLVLIEAMASGLVPIVTDLPGIKDWIDENVINPNVLYIPMPEMAGIDTPTEAGRLQFVKDVSETLAKAILSVSRRKRGDEEMPALPDTSNISWNMVSEKILNF